MFDRSLSSRDAALQKMSQKIDAYHGIEKAEYRNIDRRIAGAEKVGKHKTSMLQDVEAGRALELEALVGSVVELARITETPTPSIDAIYAATQLLGHTLATQRGRLAIQPS